MKPTIGRDVHVLTEAGVQAAKITKVWGDGDPAGTEWSVPVNLTIFVDGGQLAFAGSVPLFESQEWADAARRRGISPVSLPVAYWPPRV